MTFPVDRFLIGILSSLASSGTVYLIIRFFKASRGKVRHGNQIKDLREQRAPLVGATASPPVDSSRPNSFRYYPSPKPALPPPPEMSPAMQTLRADHGLFPDDLDEDGLPRIPIGVTSMEHWLSLEKLGFETPMHYEFIMHRELGWELPSTVNEYLDQRKDPCPPELRKVTGL